MADPGPESTGTPKPLTRWQRAKLVLKVVEVRLRFIVILVATGLFIGYWDTIKNHWDKWTRPAGAVEALASDMEFYCPMHPSVVRDSLDPDGRVPRCPICGMPLSQRKKGGESAPLPEGVSARVQLSPERIRLAGIETETVTARPLAKEVETVGYVQYDEARLSRIVTRVQGYIEKLYVNRTYQSVKEGEPLAEVYSPELFSSARELVIAAKSGGAPELVASARARLRLLGVGDSEIDEIVAKGHTEPRLVIRSPRAGHVIEKEVVEGASIEAGATLFEIADLSAVWVEAAVYEKDVGLLREGQAVEARVEAFPGQVFKGKIALVYPKLEVATRTNTVRFVLENPGAALRPGMFATARIRVGLEEIEPFKTLAAKGGEVLAVPERAVIDTGSRKVVYVERSPGLFEGVLVELGPRCGAYYAVARGLARGDRVATAGSFLIDAETRLNPAAASTFMGATGGPRAERAAPVPAGKVAEASALAVSVARSGVCPISGLPLGTMGPPHEIVIEGEKVLLCCPECEKDARSDPAKTLHKVEEIRKAANQKEERP